MEFDTYKLGIVLTLTIGFGLASVLGYISLRLRLSPILGYLIAGYMIGPYSPGFVADVPTSEQLAEIGLILMMFGVGLQLKWEELVGVRRIAIPGAIIQTIITAIAAVAATLALGWGLDNGVVIGLGIGVSSTVVLARMLYEFQLMGKPSGHIAIGWTVVEDIITVAILILLPTIALMLSGESISWLSISGTFLLVGLKFALLVLIMVTIGKYVVTYCLLQVAKTRIHEMLTLTILALTFVIATGSAFLFGTSIALGAFIAGLVIGKTVLRHQAFASASTIRDTFVVIFFLSAGMIFNPEGIANHFWLFLAILAIIVVVKPIVVTLLVLLFRYPFQTAVTVGITLSQIGEFSFIVAEEALKLKLLPDDGYDLIVACALMSIAVNPLLLRLVVPKLSQLGESYDSSLAHNRTENEAIIIGYGPLGQSISNTLNQYGYTSVIMELNIETVESLKQRHIPAYYIDAARLDALEGGHIENATLLISTVPDAVTNMAIVKAVREKNPDIQIFLRLRYLSEKELFHDSYINYIWCEEEEAIEAFTHAIQHEVLA